MSEQEEKPTPKEILDGHRFISLTTYKKNGQGVATPIWFAYYEGKLYMMTKSDTWKVKRLKRNKNVEIAPCTVKGEIIGSKMKGTGRFLEGEEAEEAASHLKKKYKLRYTLSYLFGYRKYINLELTPTEVLG